MKLQLSNTIYDLKFEMEKNDFKLLNSFNGKKRDDFVTNPIQSIVYNIQCDPNFFYNDRKR